MNAPITKKRPLIAAYYFPNYHQDIRNAKIHGPGWTEWDLIKNAQPRFSGHRQPLVPAWGYEDEADPVVMERKIEAASSHGIDAFLFDWYYYDDGPFLERCLEQGFLRAGNVADISFACMWANHDWTNIHPCQRNTPAHVCFPGLVTPKTFERITDILIDRYFSHPSYLKIGGAPFFSIYNLAVLVESFGSLAKTTEALERFREKVGRAGFSGLHLNAIGWWVAVLTGEDTNTSIFTAAEQCRFDSIGNYVWAHFVHLQNSPPVVDYLTAADVYFSGIDKQKLECRLPVLPNVTMGWDSTPRTIQSDVWDPTVGYPFTQIIGNNTSEDFRQALIRADSAAEHLGDFSMITLNAWNEWTEGSYLEPDTVRGMAYLEQVRNVFGIADSKCIIH